MFGLCAAAVGQVPLSAFVNFEGRQTSPLCLSADGTLLFAVNSADARLSVFDPTQTAPVLVKEIPVGMEPVSAHARTSDEVWVVNELSDSVSIVSVSKGIVTDTIQVKDEPADVVFSHGLAFVSVSGNNEVRVYDTGTHSLTKTISLAGQRPRAMAVSADRRKVFVAFAESGNRTTVIPPGLAPPQPPPTNPTLQKPPQVGLIVDAADRTWKPSVIKFTLPDNDVAEIDVATLSVSRYFARVGTSNLGIAVQPRTGDLFVANTDARNLVRFEPNIRGHVVDNRVTRIPIAGGPYKIADLNAGLDYGVLPNPAARTRALAQPAAIAFERTGDFAYVAAFGSDQVAKISGDGDVASRIQLGDAGSGSRTMRGPRGLALNTLTGKLYVLNRISNSLCVIDTATNAVVSEVPVGAFDPTPIAIRNGRGFLYDARLSGNGTASCASCHIDGNNDRLAWDLGDPGGEMQTVTAIASRRMTPRNFRMHPMKGPMTTQTLKGLKNLEPLHWRGDHEGFTAFNPAFESLLGGRQLSARDMKAFARFVETLTFPPNPNQELDRTLPAAFRGGDPTAGQNTFEHEEYVSGSKCSDCHSVPPAPGTDKTISSAVELAQTQPIKVPQLRNVYQKTSFDDKPAARSLDGFGLLHNGTDSSLEKFLSHALFPNFRNDAVRKKNLAAFLMCFDTGIAPAVGFTRTISKLNLSSPDVLRDWALLEAQAAARNIDLVAKGTIDGGLHGLVYDVPSGAYRIDAATHGPLSHTDLQAKLTAGDTLSLMGVPPGSGLRIGIDRDLDGRLDGDEQVTPTPTPIPD